MKSESFYWQIESFWEKYFSFEPSSFDFSSFMESENSNSRFQKKFVLCDTPDFTSSKESVFEDEYGQSFLGLDHFSLCFRSGKPIFLVDNHHEVLAPFAAVSEYFSGENMDFRLRVVHIDAHRDDAVFDMSLFNSKTPLNPPLSGGKSIQELIKKCRVCDYLDAGKKIGLIEEVIEVTQSSEFEHFILPSSSFVLNLDIDIYGEEGSAVDLELKTKVIAEAWSKADAICIATSPGFIDQKLARRIIEIFVKE